MPGCTHERLHQVSEAVLRTTWERGDDGAYMPDIEYKVLSEDTGTFTCVECEESVCLDDDRKLDDDAEFKL